MNIEQQATVLPASFQDMQRQLQAREAALAAREQALAKQEKAIQRQLAEAQALHSRNLGVRASLEAARSAAAAAKAALDTRVQHAQRLVADLRAAQAAAAEAAPAAGAAAASAGDCGLRVPAQADSQQVASPSQQAQPATPGSPTPEQHWSEQLGGPPAVGPPAPQGLPQPAARPLERAERPAAPGGHLPAAPAEARPGTKRKPEAAAGGPADAAAAAKRPALGPAHVAPIAPKAAASLHVTCTTGAHAAAAGGAAAPDGQQEGLPRARPSAAAPARTQASQQEATATAASPGAEMAAAAAAALPCSTAEAPPSDGHQLPLPPPSPPAPQQPPPLPAAPPALRDVAGSGAQPAARGDGRQLHPQHGSPQQQRRSHMAQQHAQAEHQQRQPGQPPRSMQSQQQQQQEEQQWRQACTTCPKCRAPLQGGPHTKRACKAVRRLQHTCGCCRARGHWEHECEGPARGGREPKGKRKKGRRDAPQPGVPAAAAAAGSSHGHSRAQHHVAGRDQTRSQEAASEGRPGAEVDEEGGLDDIVAALRAAQSPPQQHDKQHAGPKAAQAGDGSTGTEDGVTAVDPQGDPPAAGSSPKRQRRRALQGSCQAALTALKDDAPELLADLQSHQLMSRLAVLQMPPQQQYAQSPGAAAAAPHSASHSAGGTHPAAAAGFPGVTRALERLFPAAAAAAQGPASFWCALRASLDEQRSRVPAGAGADIPSPTGNSSPGSGSGAGGGGVGSGGGGGRAEGPSSHRAGLRPLAALETLVDLAEEAAARGEPLLWGWCRQLHAFVFVFEAAHRIVVEVPEYGNATYFFELESPMPVAAQVQRLVAVLSARGVTKGALASDAPLDASRLAGGELAALRAAGWAPGAGLRSLLNFNGERIRHDEGPSADGHSGGGSWRQRLAARLRAGASGGRVHKQPPCSAAVQGG